MTNEEIVMKIIGRIRPVGETNTDDERFENLKQMCELVNNLVARIDAIGYEFRDSQEFSVKRASDYAKNFLTKTLGITE